MNNQPILMSDEEPTDAQLSAIMEEVAIEAKQRAVLTHKQLQEKIQQEIRIAQARQKANGA